MAASAQSQWGAHRIFVKVRSQLQAAGDVERGMLEVHEIITFVDFIAFLCQPWSASCVAHLCAVESHPDLWF